MMSSGEEEFDDWLREISDRLDTAAAASIDVNAELDRVKQRAAGGPRHQAPVQVRDPIHRTIMVVDIERFGNRLRTNPHQASVREGLNRALRKAFEDAGIDWSRWHTEDRGDGVLILGPADPVKGKLAETVPGALAEALREYNDAHPLAERIRLRMALHAGEVVVDEHGVTGAAITLASRLLDCTPLRTALAESPGVLALAVSSWFFEEVVRQHPASAPETYRPVRVTGKDVDTEAWVSLPDNPYLARQLDFLATSDPTTRFEHRYLNYVRQNHSTFEHFQVNRSSAPVGYSFDEFYMIPSIARRQTAEMDSELTGVGTDPANAIAEAKRVLLLGGAGAGKTAFLTWLAHTMSTARDKESPWDRAVPFSVSLRQVADTDLPRGPEQLLDVAAPMLSSAQPDHWVRGVFESGRAILLVDGLDELVADRREYAKRWFVDFVRAYPEARYVVSSRPSAVDDDWFVDVPGRPGLVRFELLPLSSRGLGRVIESWYAAAAARETDPVRKDWLKKCQTSLWQSLSTHPNLRTLVASPLLAALLCALYRQNNKYLPRTRRELLEQALDLLLERWDDAKVSFNDAQHGVAVENELRMTKREQLILLERFAAPMVQGSELLVSRDDATRRLERAMAGLRSEGLDSVRLLQHILVRTGLLRESPVDQKIEFVHRTFRDYLAAAEMVKAGAIQTLVVNAHKDSWYEVVFMAAAQAREREVSRLLSGLLRQAAHSNDQDQANRLTLVAAACLGYADVVDPDRVRVEVQNAARRLIPPASFHDAEMLAKAGPFVIDLLPGADELATVPDQDATAARVIRTLAMIGREEAWEKIRPFTAMHHSTVVDELLRGWRQFDFSEEYAQTLLSQVEFGDRIFEIRRWELLPRLRHLANLRYLKLIGDTPLADERNYLHPLADIPNLHSLAIVANEIVRDLEPLVRCRNLQELKVFGPSLLQDLSALARTSVEHLELRTLRMTVSGPLFDLGTLAGAPIRHLSIRHPDFAHGLYSLPADLPLTELYITNRAEQRTLLGIARWPALTTVGVAGVPTAAEVAELGTLTNLRHLDLYDVSERNVDLARTATEPLGGVTVEVHTTRVHTTRVTTTRLGG